MILMLMYKEDDKIASARQITYMAGLGRFRHYRTVIVLVKRRKDNNERH